MFRHSVSPSTTVIFTTTRPRDCEALGVVFSAHLLPPACPVGPQWLTDPGNISHVRWLRLLDNVSFSVHRSFSLSFVSPYLPLFSLFPFCLQSRFMAVAAESLSWADAPLKVLSFNSLIIVPCEFFSFPGQNDVQASVVSEKLSVAIVECVIPGFKLGVFRFTHS